MDHNYDPSDKNSIEQYAKNLVGNSFREIINTYGDQIDYTIPTAENEDALIQNLSNKGSLGQLIEKYFFHYENNNDSDPDFPKAGVELKVSCYRKTNKGELRAKERLILHMINYMTVVNEDFENSSLWHKIANILFVYYLYDANIKDRLDYRIDYTYMFTPPAEDLAIIKHDYEVIVDKIRQGKAHELSEGDTLYLGAATKAATSANRTQQPFSDIPAKPRAFSYKNSYMTYVLNTYILKQQEPAERILSSDSNESLKQYVERRLRPYYGYCVDDILTKLNIEITSNPKHLYALLAYRMLGIKGNQAEEFIKANIVVKAIRIEATGTIKESISFPAFSFQELANEDGMNQNFAQLCAKEHSFL